MVIGTDVSKWQRDIDWHVMRAAGARFVFIKATQGLFEDPKFREFWQGSRGKLLRGAYHFWQPGVPAMRQAETFFEAVSSTGDLGELPPVLDLEKGPVTWPEVVVFAQAVETRFRRPPILYSRPAFLDSLGDPPKIILDLDLWVAHYTDAPEPVLPRAWKETRRTWRLWQYTNQGDGKKYGVGSGLVDLNRFNGDLAALLRWAFQGREWKAIAWLCELQSTTPELVLVKGEKWQVKASALRVRKGPGLNYDAIGLLHRGDVIGVGDKVQADGYTWGRIVDGKFVGGYTALEFCEKMEG